MFRLAGLLTLVCITFSSGPSAFAQQTDAEKKAREERLKRHRELVEKARERSKKLAAERKKAAANRPKRATPKRSSSKTSTRKKYAEPKRRQPTRSGRSTTSKSRTSGSGRPTADNNSGRLIDSPAQYRPVRDQDYAYLVVLETVNDIVRRKWVGSVYFRVTHSNSEYGGPGEMLSIGELQCYKFHAPTETWQKSAGNIGFPQIVRIGDTGVYTGSVPIALRRKSSLPLEMHLVTKPIEIIFPDVPRFYKKGPQERRARQSYSASGVKSLGMNSAKSTFDTLDITEVRGFRSSTPVVHDVRAMADGKSGIGLRYTMTTKFSRTQGMPLRTDGTYELRWGKPQGLKISVVQLRGADLNAAKKKALREFPTNRWPKKCLRIPLHPDKYEVGRVDSASDLRPNETVGVHVPLRTSNINTIRTYRAKVLKAVDEKVAVEFAGSKEREVVKLSAIRQLK